MKNYMIDPTDTNRYFKIFFDYIRLLVDIPESDQAISRKYFTPLKVKKDTILLRAGQIPRYHYFIVSGFMRNYFIDEEGKEVITDINDGPRFFNSFNHYINQTPTNENLHCITDCELLRISWEDSAYTATISKKQLEYKMLILQESLENGKQRSIDLSSLTAEERYYKLMTNHPAILQNVPLKYIASYLGINAGSLSRIRNMSR